MNGDYRVNYVHHILSLGPMTPLSLDSNMNIGSYVKGKRAHVLITDAKETIAAFEGMI